MKIKTLIIKLLLLRDSVILGIPWVWKCREINFCMMSSRIWLSLILKTAG